MDNKFRMDTKRALLDMVRTDRMAVFYRGLFPLLNSQICMHVCVEWCHRLCFEHKVKGMEVAWPALFLAGCGVAHLNIVLASKIYCGRYTHPRNQIVYTNTFHLFTEVARKHKMRGLFAGFAPAFPLYCLGYWSKLEELTNNTIKIIRKK